MLGLGNEKGSLYELKSDNMLWYIESYMLRWRVSMEAEDFDHDDIYSFVERAITE
jgi:hypothetical protein